ncbi:CheR family methyltransferase [Rhodovulum sp. YEN HP10]|uniref:CheR family methyltransferase n=1 Tax=Rhodovulum sp. HP10 TaxID=3387397 RepID=UPI0039E1A30B
MIGIGAPADGSSALESFFATCPAGSGAAFVVIQDLAPGQESRLAERLARYSPMPVEMMKTDTRIAPDHVYLLPPGKLVRIEKGLLRLAPRGDGPALPIDIFFTSLAGECGARACGIVLSGTGPDGSRGAIAINAAGGLALSQDSGEAGGNAMPAGLRRAGIVDAGLPATELARRALDRRQWPPQIPLGPEPAAREQPFPEESEAILQALEDATGTDFRLYKSSTVLRRIGRRMQVLGQPDLKSYAALLQSLPGEVTALNRELLISVTRFFRDEEAFRVIGDRVIPGIVETLPPGQTARVWVAGCATGEEAYSLAMLLHEAFDKAGREPRIKVFATDINPDSLQVASAGSYPASAGAEIGPERMERYFRTDGGRLQVRHTLRRSLVFARHDLLSDPPFSRMDLVSCRNTLIYFRPAAQKDALLRLQYAIRKSGHLFLGSSETLSSLQNGFQPVDARHKVFVRVSSRPSGQFVLSSLKTSSRHDRRLPPLQAGGDGDPEIRPTMSAEPPSPRSRAPLSDRPATASPGSCALPCIMVNDRHEAIHLFGDLRPFLPSRPGVAGPELARILPEALVATARRLLDLAMASNTARSSDPVEMPLAGTDGLLRLHAVTLPAAAPGSGALLSFERLGQASQNSPEGGKPVELPAEAQARIDGLGRELDRTRADLEATIQELETSNEELLSVNEELLASNDELQGANAELQWVNEEINALNADYQEKMALMNRLNADLGSMVQSAGVATVFLDEALLITRFSPEACSVFKLRDSDIGQPLCDIAHKLHYPDLLEDIRDTIRSEAGFERETTAEDGALYRVRITPYAIQASGHRGALVTLRDVTAHRDLARLRGVIDAMPEPVAALDADGTITLVNKAWKRCAHSGGDAAPDHCSPGGNYLAACLMPPQGLPVPFDPEDPGLALRAREGLKSVLEGRQPKFSVEYPCHGPTEGRRVCMTATPVPGSAVGAVIRHVEIDPWLRKGTGASLNTREKTQRHGG